MGEHNVLNLEHVKLVLEMMYSLIKGATALPNEIYIIALLRNIIYKLADLLHHDANHNDKMREHLNSFILCTFQFKLILINGSLLNHLVLFLLIVADLKNKKVKMFNLTDKSYGMFKIPPGVLQTQAANIKNHIYNSSVV